MNLGFQFALVLDDVGVQGGPSGCFLVSSGAENETVLKKNESLFQRWSFSVRPEPKMDQNWQREIG